MYNFGIGFSNGHVFIISVITPVTVLISGLRENINFNI
jgi:hypothetical protein